MIQDALMTTAEMPLVSILIPAYNHERFVERCLDSVLEDPYPNKELVIIDDGSSDGTAGRIAGWAARHRDALPVEYVHRDNRGIAATLNELAARARGAFLRLGASDDYLLPGGLEAQVRYLLTHARKWAVVGDSIVVDQHGYTLHGSGMRDLHGADKRLYASDEGIRRAIISQWAIGGSVALVRRNALEKIAGWSERLRIDDWDFFLRLAAHDALGFIDVPVCAYRLHDTNVSRVRDKAVRVRNLAEAQRVAARRMELFDEPYRSLLQAQQYLLGAKIAFLQRRPGWLVFHLAAYGMLLAASRLRLSFAHSVEERA